MALPALLSCHWAACIPQPKGHPSSSQPLSWFPLALVGLQPLSKVKVPQVLAGAFAQMCRPPQQWPACSLTMQILQKALCTYSHSRLHSGIDQVAG